MTEHQAYERQKIARWSENQALIEWQVARMAAGCYEVATAGQSSQVRNQAARLNASYAVSSYAIMTGRSPLVQVLSLVAMSVLHREVWVESGRAAAEFGGQAKPIKEAIVEIQERVREHAAKYLTAEEFRGIESAVRAWAKDNPAPRALEFIRFDLFADEVAREAGKRLDVGGLFGSITGEARNLEFLGERTLLLMSRMPRLAQWHAEAAAANVLDQPEMVAAFAAMKQLGELRHILPERLKTLESLDRGLASMPAELVLMMTQQPEFKDVLAQIKDTAQQVQALDRGVNALEKSITRLDGQLAQLNNAVRPEAMRQLAEHTGDIAWARARAILLLATACGAVLLILRTLLRRLGDPTRNPTRRNLSS